MNGKIFLVIPLWTTAHDELVLQVLDRPQQNMRVALADVRTGKVHTILEDRDST
jgi:hypothetical protein